MSSRAEHKVEREYIADTKHVMGKNQILFRIAEAALANPERRVRDVIFPVVSEATLHDLVAEFRASGIGYHERVHQKLRGSYSQHYRQIVPEILRVLDFRSNNLSHRPLIQALSLLKEYVTSKQIYYPT
jgi:hypothetical protein